MITLDLSYYLLGYYTISVKAEDYGRFINICAHHGIVFFDIQISDTCTFAIRSDQLDKMTTIADKTNISYEIVKLWGLPAFFSQIKQYVSFYIGAVIALFFLIILSTKVWNIQIIGNNYYGPDVFQRFLLEQGIKTGMPVNNLHCVELSAQIREYFEHVTWASCEIEGCNLNIYIKENLLMSLENNNESPADKAYDLIAEKDGIIHSAFVRKGILNVEIGQTVKKGDCLIKGLVPVYNDAMEIISYQTVASDGDIKVLREYAYYEKMNCTWVQDHVIDIKKTPFIQIDKYRFDFKTANLNGNLYQKTISSKENQFFFIKTGINTVLTYEKIPQKYSDQELKHMAQEHFDDFCADLLKKGVQIYENNVKMVISDVSCVTSGKLIVIESIGVQKETPDLSYDESSEE